MIAGKVLVKQEPLGFSETSLEMSASFINVYRVTVEAGAGIAALEKPIF